jgi:anti-sigma B factor antagonist
MFDIDFNEHGHIVLSGRLDAAQAHKALEFLDRLAGECVMDLASLEYISSAGLGVLLKTHKRLMAGSSGLKLLNLNSHISDVFRYSGFDKLFEINVIQP